MTATQNPAPTKHRVPLTQEQLQKEMGRRLAEARADAGLSQTDVCKRLPQLDMSKALLSNWEVGRHPAPHLAVTSLARLYARSVQWIVTGTEPVPGGPDMDEKHYQLALRLAGLQPHMYQFVEQAIELAHEAQGKLHESLVGPPTFETWLHFANLLHSVSRKK